MQLEDMIKKDKSFNWSDDEIGEDSRDPETGKGANEGGGSKNHEIVSTLKSRVQQRHSKKQKYKQ